MPLDNVTWFYGRANKISELFALLNKQNPQNVSIVGQRRIGKSWLLQRIARDTALHSSLLTDFNQFTFIYWDLQTEPILNQDIFFRRLVDLVMQHLPEALANECRAVCNPSEPEESLADILELIEVESHRVILLIDEFAAITRNREFAEQFFAHLRSLFQRSALTCVTASYRSLGEMCHLGPDSPFFNIFWRIQLGLFGNDEARSFVTDSFGAAGITVQAEAVSEIIRLTGPHPCFISQVCQDLSHHLAADVTLSRELVEQRHEAFHTAVFDDFSYYLNRLRQDDEQALAMLQSIAENPPSSSVTGPVYTRLRNLSLVRETRGRLEPFSEGFRQFVLSNRDTNSYFEQAFANPQLSGPNFVRMCEILLGATADIPTAMKTDLAEAIRAMSSRPRDAMRICGRDVLDPLMKHIYQAIVGGRWHGDQFRTCELFNDRAHDGHFPKHLAAHFTSIRIYGNHGSHPNQFGEACTPARAFLTVIETIHLAEEVFQRYR